MLPTYRLSLQPALAYPPTDRPGTPAHPLCCLGNRKHKSMIRTRPDEALEQSLPASYGRDKVGRR